MSEFKIDTAVVMAAGVGTRDLPMSKARGKEMAEVYGLPLIDLIAHEFADAGVENLVIVVSDETDVYGQNIQEQQLRRWFDPSPRLERYLIDNGKADMLPMLENSHGLKPEYVVQHEDGRYGTAAPLYIAETALRGVERFFVVNGDDLCAPSNASPFRQLVSNTGLTYAAHGMMAREVPTQETGEYPYGMLRVSPVNRLLEIVEKPLAVDFQGLPLATNSFTTSIR